MTPDEILQRLDELANTKVGAPIPEWMHRPNDWGTALSELCRESARTIRELQKSVSTWRMHT